MKNRFLSYGTMKCEGSKPETIKFEAMGLRTFEASGRDPQRPGTSLHFLFNVGRFQIASCQGCHLFGHLPLLQSNSLHPTWDVKSEIRKLQIFVFGMSFLPYSSVCALRIGGQSDKCVEDPSHGFKATRDAGDLCRFVRDWLCSRFQRPSKYSPRFPQTVYDAANSA